MINKRPKISIVTPSFNQGEFIEEAIQSVISQNYDNFEHIIIDACSTDYTLHILKKYSHLIWISEPDKGQSDALNKGFVKATGDWILWLNADDVLMPHAFDKVVTKINVNKDWTVIHGNVRFFYDKTKELFRNQYFAKFNHLNTVFRVVTPPSTGTFFNAKFLKQNLLDIDFHYMMDTEWYMRNGKNIRVVNLDEFLVKFRLSSDNKTVHQITDGVLNDQQKVELNKLYTTYGVPLLSWVPSIFQLYTFRIITSLLRLINRIKKIKYVVKPAEIQI